MLLMPVTWRMRWIFDNAAVRLRSVPMVALSRAVRALRRLGEVVRVMLIAVGLEARATLSAQLVVAVVEAGQPAHELERSGPRRAVDEGRARRSGPWPTDRPSSPPCSRRRRGCGRWPRGCSSGSKP